MSKTKKYLKLLLYPILAISLIFISKTIWDIKSPTLSLQAINAGSQRFKVLDRYGKPLAISYQNKFNTMNIVPLHAMPPLLQQAFITSEDRHFYEHHGNDWKARMHALWQNIRAMRAVRGASTITEQVVRIIHPRPRTLWSRWIEGFEAILLETHASKGEILEFYLNQVPYAANRRGVAEAARYYFNRDLLTLTHKEMLALAVLPRAPSLLDLYKNQDTDQQNTIEQMIIRLADSMVARGELQPEQRQDLLATKFLLEASAPTLSAEHFVNYIRETVPYRVSDKGILLTSLDGVIQQKAQSLLDQRIKALRRKKVHNGAVLVVDHSNGEIIAWAVAGAGNEDLKNQTPGSAIDAVRVPRQPGSAMKPFLYALALDSGWTAATELDDVPMAEAIGTGLHDFHNYSHIFYGKISLREALGNSLNIPALETIGFVTPERYLETLHNLGFISLSQPAQFYNDGLALGNGEVSLFEMVQAYSALANLGVFHSLTALSQTDFIRENKRIYSEEAASLIAHILSDPYARRREFGAGGLLNLPVQTAVKTGTSTDYRDAWTLGFNSRYVVGVWLGNLDQTPMDGVTGAGGPALILRAIFAELSKREKLKPLYLSPKLVQAEICTDHNQKISNQETEKNCFTKTEYFIPGTLAENIKPEPETAVNIKLIRPTENLQIAYDPRIPKKFQEFEFVAAPINHEHKIEWIINGTKLATTTDSKLLWPIERGHYTLIANEIDASGQVVAADTKHFLVK